MRSQHASSASSQASSFAHRQKRAYTPGSPISLFDSSKNIVMRHTADTQTCGCTTLAVCDWPIKRCPYSSKAAHCTVPADSFPTVCINHFLSFGECCRHPCPAGSMTSVQRALAADAGRRLGGNHGQQAVLRLASLGYTAVRVGMYFLAAQWRVWNTQAIFMSSDRHAACCSRADRGIQTCRVSIL